MLLMTIEQAKYNIEALKSKAKIMSNSEELLDLISGFEMMVDCFEVILYDTEIEDPDPIGTAKLLKEMDDSLHESFSLAAK